MSSFVCKIGVANIPFISDLFIYVPLAPGILTSLAESELQNRTKCMNFSSRLKKVPENNRNRYFQKAKVPSYRGDVEAVPFFDAS